MADCHVPLTIPEANAGRISAPVPSSLLKWPMVKKKTRSIACVQTPPPSFRKNREEGEGIWTQATMNTDLKKPKHKWLNVLK